MPNVTVNGTGYITLYNNTGMQGWTQDLYVGISKNKNIPVAIVRLGQSVSAALGATSAIHWSDLDITSATLEIKQRDSCPTGNYFFALCSTGIGDPNDTLEYIAANAHYSNGFYYSGTQGANEIVTFDLTSLFKTIPDTNAFTPLTSQWYIYFYRSSGYASNQRFYRRGSEGYTPILNIEGYQKAGCHYYTNGDWQNCKIHYYTNGDWVPNN